MRALVPWARTSWYRPRFQRKGLGVETLGAPGERGGSPWAEAGSDGAGPMSARDQTRVHRPRPGGAAHAAGEWWLRDGCPPAGADASLRPANLQGRRLSWGLPCSGPRETWLTGYPCRPTGSALASAMRSPVTPLPTHPFHHRSPPGRGTQTPALGTTVSPIGRKISQGNGGVEGGRAPAGRRGPAQGGPPLLSSGSCRRQRRRPRAFPALCLGVGAASPGRPCAREACSVLK